MNSYEFIRDLRDYLMTGVDLVALIGDKLSPDIAPRGSQPPYIVYSEVGGSDGFCHDGTASEQVTRIQFDMVSSSALEVRKIADELDKQLNATSGPFVHGDTLFEYIHRQGSGVSQNDDDAESPDDMGVNRRVIDYLISWQPKTNAGY